MLNGFRLAVSHYTRKHVQLPSIFALYSYRDFAEDNLHRNKSYCTVRDKNMVPIATYSLPPIFSQNRFFNSTTYVVVPDFTYFSDFYKNHNHGDVNDIWFNELERTRSRLEKKGLSFSSKKLGVIWRGTYCTNNCGHDKHLARRSWNDYRAELAMSKNSSQNIDTAGHWISKS